jgi:endoglucanase
MKRITLLLPLLILLAAACQSGSSGSNDWFSGEPTGMLPADNDFFHADGQNIVDGGGNPFLIRGVAFGNEVWNNPSIPPSTHHGEIDYQRAADMGFNCIRFYINYKIFEEDSNPYVYKQTGFDWIDQNLVWAEAHGIKLILNMHVPQGGFQSQSNGDALWNDRENQKRLVALWKEIARRYADEPDIIAFDLVNEPVVTKSLDQWRNLAAEIVWNIRQVDPRHIIMVERMNANEGSTSNSWDPNQNGEMNFFLINDRNMVYEFHTYNPMSFTHQGAGWIDSLKNVTSVWPDENRLETTGGTTWAGATFGNPTIAAGTTGWTFFEGTPLTVTDPFYKIGRPALQGNGLAAGTVWYDDLTLTERTSSGAVVRTWNYDFNTDEGFYYWSDPVKGQGTWSATGGRGGSGCWTMTGSGTNAVLTDIIHGIRITTGNNYIMSGWMKGQNVPAGTQVRLRLDLFSSTGEVYTWNKAYLAAEIDRYLAFGTEHEVPLYLGEFGCIVAGFEPGQGGLVWVEDMLDICEEKGIHYNYHTWHETAFGIYLNSPTILPANPNQPLIDLFTEKQNP